MSMIIVLFTDNMEGLFRNLNIWRPSSLSELIPYIV